MVLINCKKCGTKFKTYESKLKNNKGIYCSKKCSYSDRKKLSEEHKLKISIGTKKNLPKTAFKKGSKPWNTGKSGYSTKRKNKSFEKIVGIKKANIWKKKLSLAKKGKSHEQIFGIENAKKRKQIIKEKVHSKIIGKKRPDMSLYWKLKRQKENTDVSPKQLQKLRKHGQYKLWRKNILERDNYSCVKCKSKENLEVDHKIPIIKNKKLMFDLSNGQVLCKKCHIKKTRIDLQW